MNSNRINMMNRFLLMIFFLIISNLSLAQIVEIPFEYEDKLKINETTADSLFTIVHMRVRVCVDRMGVVQSAEVVESSVEDEKLREIAIENALKWKFSSKLSAPEIQCGTISYEFKVE